MDNPFKPTLAEFVFTELPDYLEHADYSENQITINLFCNFDVIFEYDSSNEIPDWLTIYIYDYYGKETDIFKVTRKEDPDFFNIFLEAYQNNYQGGHL